jgi:nucleotide-binding universal stress UspA family protein
MKRVLLILTVPAPAPRSMEHALGICRDEGATLIAAHVHDPEITQSLERRALTSGFLGERVGEKIHQALEEDDHLRIDVQLREVAAEAERAGIECRTLQAEGRFAPVVMRLATEHGATRVIIARERRSLLARLVFGSPADELRRAPGLSLDVIDEI